MPRVKVNDHANAETRAKGARAANAARIKNREKREAEADEALVNSLGRAVEVLSEALEATLRDEPDYPTRLRAAGNVLDRLLGKPSQSHKHSGGDGGPIVMEHAVDVRRVLRGLAERGLIRPGPAVAADAAADEVHPA